MTCEASFKRSVTALRCENAGGAEMLSTAANAAARIFRMVLPFPLSSIGRDMPVPIRGGAADQRVRAPSGALRRALWRRYRGPYPHTRRLHLAFLEPKYETQFIRFSRCLLSRASAAKGVSA